MDPGADPSAEIDLDTIERELADVEVALDELDHEDSAARQHER